MENITLTVNTDSIIEGEEVAQIAIVQSENYTVGSPGETTMTINDLTSKCLDHYY